MHGFQVSRYVKFAIFSAKIGAQKVNCNSSWMLLRGTKVRKSSSMYSSANCSEMGFYTLHQLRGQNYNRKRSEEMTMSPQKTFGNRHSASLRGVFLASASRIL